MTINSGVENEHKTLPNNLNNIKNLYGLNDGSGPRSSNSVTKQAHEQITHIVKNSIEPICSDIAEKTEEDI